VIPKILNLKKKGEKGLRLKTPIKKTPSTTTTTTQETQKKSTTTQDIKKTVAPTPSTGTQYEPMVIPLGQEPCIHSMSKSDYKDKEKALSCPLCKEEFGKLYNRSIHCKQCGSLVCKKCAPSRIPDQGKTAVAVCNGCLKHFLSLPKFLQRFEKDNDDLKIKVNELEKSLNITSTNNNDPLPKDEQDTLNWSKKFFKVSENDLKRKREVDNGEDEQAKKKRRMNEEKKN